MAEILLEKVHVNDLFQELHIPELINDSETILFEKRILLATK